MIKFFNDDSSGFRNKILVLILFSVMFFAGSFIVSGMYNTKMVANNNERAKIVAQTDWLQKFDYRDAEIIYKSMLKPCKQIELERVQMQQLDILKRHNLKISSVSNDAVTTEKKGNFGSVKSSVLCSGSWDDITAALNEFERQNLVVIIALKFSNESKDNKNNKDKGGKGVTVKIDYNIYYA